MSELSDFKYFKENQLHFVDFDTGRIDTKFNGKNHLGATREIIRKNVGSKNEDGYIRL